MNVDNLFQIEINVNRRTFSGSARGVLDRREGFLLWWVQGGIMAHMRVARPTDDLKKISHMYRDGLDFEILGKFKDHDGFDGVILGKLDLGFHLEFTHQAGHPAGRAPTKDHLLVFYYPGRETWRRICDRMTKAGFRTVASWNPYWNAKGRTFEDPDGYRVVIQNEEEPYRGGSDRREEGKLAL